MQTLTIQLPEEVYRHLQQVAKETNQPMEDIAFQTIQGNLPPLIDNLSTDLRNGLIELQNLDDQTLWKVASEVISDAQWEAHQTLLSKNQETELTLEETTELSRLRTATDHFVLRRSYALALLKWRGHTIAQGTPHI